MDFIYLNNSFEVRDKLEELKNKGFDLTTKFIQIVTLNDCFIIFYDRILDKRN